MEIILTKFKLDPAFPADTEMARAIQRLLAPYDEKEFLYDRIFMAEDIADALKDGLDITKNDYIELTYGEIVWINN